MAIVELKYTKDEDYRGGEDALRSMVVEATMQIMAGEQNVGCN